MLSPNPHLSEEYGRVSRLNKVSWVSRVRRVGRVGRVGRFRRFGRIRIRIRIWRLNKRSSSKARTKERCGSDL
jgi:hypothetical protein